MEPSIESSIQGNPCTAGNIAKSRFLGYVSEKLAGEWDSNIWEFWTDLLEQAKRYRIVHTGYESTNYKKDKNVAVENYKAAHPSKDTCVLPKRRGRH